MLSQLSSDVITPPPMKPKKQENLKIETSQVMQHNIIPTIDEKPKQVLNEMSPPVVELPEETEIDDDDDDITQIKTKILKTLSKIEQAEVD